jgi:hypothetical protein
MFRAMHYPRDITEEPVMAQSARLPAWKRPGSPIGRKGPRKAHPRYSRNKNMNWSAGDVRELRRLARENTPTRVIGLKLGRTETSVRSKAQREGISLKPANRSPYTRRRRAGR